MSSKNGRLAGGKGDEDVDFDFFDSPRRDDSPEPRKGRSNAGHRHDSDHSRSPPHSRRSRSNSDSNTDTDSYTDTASDSRSRTPSSERESRIKKNVRKIEARIPSTNTHTTKISLSDSRDYDSDDSESGRRAPTHGKNDRRSKDSKKSRPTSAHPKKDSKRRSKSYSDSETSSSETSTGSDVTDVSPLNSPTLHSASRHELMSSGNKPPKSPSRRPISAGSSNRDPLLVANKDSVDMNLLMQAIMEMEQTRSSDGQERQTKRTLQNLMYAPPPRARPQPKKNFSFDNDKVRGIDRENQRLMQNILRHAQEAKKSKQKVKAIRKVEPVRPTRMTTSAINRMKEQQRIEQDNRSFLKRLEQTKPSKEMRREDLMQEFNKSMYGYGFAAPSTKTRPRSTASPYDGEGSVASGYSLGSRTRSETGSAGSGLMGRRRPQSAKVIARPHSATFRPVSGKTRPLSATSSMSNKRLSAKPNWEDGW